MDNQIVQFESNVPQTVALQYADGLNVQGRFGPRVMYTLSDGRRMYLDLSVAASIQQGHFQPGEPFQITKRVSADGKHTRWDVDPVERKPVESTAPGPELVSRGTGTYGAAPQPRVAPAIPARVPMNVAFGEIVSFVRDELKARNEQWNDEARQAAACTLLIHAGREGWLAPWERK